MPGTEQMLCKYEDYLHRYDDCSQNSSHEAEA